MIQNHLCQWLTNHTWQSWDISGSEFCTHSPVWRQFFSTYTNLMVVVGRSLFPIFRRFYIVPYVSEIRKLHVPSRAVSLEACGFIMTSLEPRKLLYCFERKVDGNVCNWYFFVFNQRVMSHNSEWGLVALSDIENIFFTNRRWSFFEAIVFYEKSHK